MTMTIIGGKGTELVIKESNTVRIFTDIRLKYIDDQNCNDPSFLWAEIHYLHEELKGPEGYSTWKEAAVAEKIRRIAAENKLKEIND